MKLEVFGHMEIINILYLYMILEIILFAIIFTLSFISLFSIISSTKQIAIFSLILLCSFLFYHIIKKLDINYE